MLCSVLVHETSLPSLGGAEHTTPFSLFFTPFGGEMFGRPSFFVKNSPKIFKHFSTLLFSLFLKIPNMKSQFHAKRITKRRQSLTFGCAFLPAKDFATFLRNRNVQSRVPL